jgi:hypothetical protein
MNDVFSDEVRMFTALLLAQVVIAKIMHKRVGQWSQTSVGNTQRRNHRAICCVRTCYGPCNRPPFARHKNIPSILGLKKSERRTDVAWNPARGNVSWRSEPNSSFTADTGCFSRGRTAYPRLSQL